MQQISPPGTSLDQEPRSCPPSPPLLEADDLEDQDPSSSSPLEAANQENLDLDEDFDDIGEDTCPPCDEVPPLPDDLPAVTNDPVVLPKIIESLRFIEMLENATLESQLAPEDLEAIRNPTPHSSTPTEDPDLLLSISAFIDFLNCSQEAYENMRKNIQRRDPSIEMLSYHKVKRTAEKLSGIVTLKDDMCIDSCAAFTGPFADLQACPRCGKPRYDPARLEASGGKIKIPQRQFSTFPAGPQIQARWKNPEMAEKMLYRQRRTAAGETEDYDDILSGSAYLDQVEEGKINGYDTLLMFSIDGAQLYRDKKSECWIYIWILLEMAPDERYKVRNILPGGIIPGPRSPEHLESFIFPGLAHVSALQKEGLRLYDSYTRTFQISLFVLFLVLADAVAMAKLTGSVGHHGRKGCRLLCDLPGRNKPGGPHFYPAMLRPTDINHPSASHPDIDINHLPSPNHEAYRRKLNYVMTSPNQTEYKKRRLQTGISKPSIFDGLVRILELPGCFPGDLMHQPIINLPGLLFDLWCQRRELRKHDKDSDWPWAVLTGDVWVEHGKAVDAAGCFLPRSFDRVPRNPQEKISSGYKACEFLVYVYILGPGLFYNILPEKYYLHFCKLVKGIRLIYQRSISREQLRTAHKSLLEYCIEFEHLYYQRKPNRLHFVRQSIHSLTHLGPETNRLGPLSLSAQWTMERIIGVLGSLVKQPSNPFANLTEQAKKMATINALLSMWPEVGHKSRNPRGSIDLGRGYVLLRPRDDGLYRPSPDEQDAITRFLDDGAPAARSLYRWGRLQISNGQLARSRWKEIDRSQKLARTDRILKVI